MADALHTAGLVVSAQDARLDDAGLLAPQTSTLDVRTGVLMAPGATALVTGTTATAPMTVSIAPHHWIGSRGTANGPYRGASEITRTVNIAAAPGANSRIDVVYARQADATAGVPSPDASTAEEYGVVTGTAAVSPTKPSLPVGAVELATVTVAAGATNTAGAGVTIAQTARLTSTRGGEVYCRTATEQAALTPYDTLRVYRADLKAPLEYFNGSWHFMGPSPLPAVNATWPEPAGTFGNNPAPLTSLTVPDPGFPYRISVVAACELGATAAGTRWDLNVFVSGGGFAEFQHDFTIATAELTQYQRITSGVSSQVFNGSCTVMTRALRAYGTGLGNITAFNRRLSVYRHAA